MKKTLLYLTADFKGASLKCLSAVVLVVGAMNCGFAQTYMNGNLSTGVLSKSGVTAPVGYTWSEMQNDLGNTTESNGTTGVGAQILGTTANRVADDFTVPAGQTWNLTKVTFYAYQTGFLGTVSPFVDVRVRISNGNPSVGAPTVVFGDLTTNRLLASSEAMIYRIANSTTPSPGTVPGTTRKIWKIEATVNVSLTSGTYWIEWMQDAGASGNFSPPSTVVDARTVPGYNAVQFISATSTWAPLLDAGNPSPTAPDVAIDMPFMIDYTLTLGVSEEAVAKKVSVYPNPVNDVVTISASADMVFTEASVYDIAGRLVKKISTNSGIQDINVSELSAGNYVLKLQSEAGSFTGKFIKQ